MFPFNFILLFLQKVHYILGPSSHYSGILFNCLMSQPPVRRSTRSSTRKPKSSPQESFLCEHCGTVCTNERYLITHQRTNPLCRLISHNEVFAPNEPGLVAVAMASVPPSQLNHAIKNDDTNRIIFTSDVPEEIDIESNQHESSNGSYDNFMDNLDSKPAADERHDQCAAERSHMNCDDSSVGCQPTFHYEHDVIPLFPNPDGKTKPISTDFPFDQVRNVQAEVIEESNEDRVSSIENRMLLLLMVLLDRIKAPHYAFQEILQWIEIGIQKEYLARGSQGPKQYSKQRTTFISNLKQNFPDIAAPNTTTIALEDRKNKSFHHGEVKEATDGTLLHSGVTMSTSYKRSQKSVVHIPHFNAKEQIVSLLTAKGLFTNVDNLVVNKSGAASDMFLPYKLSDQDRLDEIHSASWYQSTSKQSDIDVEREFIFPLISYIDATGIDAYSRYRLEPWIITTSVLKREVRLKSSSWRILGFVPDL